MADHNIIVSATEIPQFRRLAAFLTEASVYADATEDDDLREMVRECRIDLLHLMAERDEPEQLDG